MTVDLATLDTKPAAEAGRPVELRHPATRAPLGIFVTVVGLDSDQYRLAVRERQMKRVNSGTATEPTAAELVEEDLDMLAACVTGWTGMVLDGKPVEFSLANARMIVQRFPWIRDQLDREVGNRANFLPN